MPTPLSAHALRRIDRRLLAGLLAAALVLTAMVTTQADAADPGIDVVYIARGFDFPDALVGAVIAAMNGAPILTVRGPAEGDDIPPATTAELVRLSPGEIVIFGGLAVVSQNVESQLGAFTDPPGNTRRLAGADRFGTAVEISQALPAKIANVLHADSANHADTADHADSANHADTADTADTAEDAEMLQGFSANELVRASGTSSSTNIDDFSSGSFTSILEHEVTAPVDGVLLVWGSVAAIRDADGPATAKLTVQVTVNGDVAALPMSMFLQSDSLQESSATPTGAIPVTAGTLSVDIEAWTPTGLAFIRERQLTTLFVPFGDSGEPGALLGFSGGIMAPGSPANANE